MLVSFAARLSREVGEISVSTWLEKLTFPPFPLYVGQTISVGFLDPEASQNETIAGVFRLVTPTLTYSNHT